MSTSDDPLVSVIIPCHNYGVFLPDALESLIAQSWTSWECIVIDDGSNDNTRDTCKQYECRDSRIRYMYQPKQGVSAARNTGIAASHGRYIQLLDADDKLEPEKLRSQAEFLLAHPEVDVIYGEASYFEDGDLPVHVVVGNRMPFPQFSGCGNDLLKKLIRRNITVVNTPLIRRSVFEGVGMFDVTLAGHEDWEYWLRCAIAGKYFQYDAVPNGDAVIRVHASSAVQNVVPMIQTNLAVRDRLEHIGLPWRLRRLNHYGISLQYVKLAKIELHSGAIGSTLSIVAKALWSVRTSPKIFLILLLLITPGAVMQRLAIYFARLQVKPPAKGTT
jgi:glycosyltransferase involved in cell wall biosynthesis